MPPTDTIATFRAELVTDDAGGATIRIAPFGETITTQYGTHRFEPGSIRMPATPPRIVADHSRDSILDTVGVLRKSSDTDKAMYGSLDFANSTKAQDVRELLKLGAISDVSVGVANYEIRGGVMYGDIDHVGIVVDGAYGKADQPSKVLAVHSKENPPMGDDTKATDEVAIHATDTTTADLEALTTEVAELRADIDKLDLAKTRVTDEAKPFPTLAHFWHAKALALTDLPGAPVAKHNLANFVMSADTTTTGAGAVPDYLSEEYLAIFATSRPFTDSLPKDPIGDHGMSVVYPQEVTGPTVTAQSSQFDQPSSTTMDIDPLSVDLVTYSGANRVSIQLVARSQPSFVDVLIRGLYSAYAKVTDAAGILAVLGAAGDTAIVADLSADAAATYAAFGVANAAVIAGIRRPADTVWLAPDRWAELNALADSEGRPLLVYGANGPMNAQGQSGFNTMVAQYHGWTVRLVPDAAAETVLVGHSSAAAILESEVPQLQVTNIDTTSMDFGIWGLYAPVTKFADGFYDITAS